MNLQTVKTYPTTLEETLTHLYNLLRGRSDGYAQVAAGDPLSILGAWDTDGQIATAFYTLGSICMLTAPTPGTSAMPSAIELIKEKMMIHFGGHAFGQCPQSPSDLANDLDITLELYQHACLHEGKISEYTFNSHGDTIRLPGVDRADAALAYLAHTGVLACLPLLPDGTTHLPMDISLDIDEPTRHILEMRLNRAAFGYQAAE